MPASDPISGLVETLVSACASRIARYNRKSQAFFAVGVSLLAVCLLLLLGTRYFPAALLALAVCFGVWAAIARRMASTSNPYVVAQRIDASAGLADEFATAFYFRSTAGAGPSERVVESQYERAASCAREVRAEAVVPDKVPPPQRASAWLLAAAVALLGLRLVVQSPFSFEPPLATLLLGPLFGAGAAGQGPEPPSAGRMDSGLPDAVQTDDAALAEELRPSAEPPADDLPDEHFEGDEERAQGLPEVEGLITLPLEEPAAEGAAQGESGEGPADGAESGDETPDPVGDDWSEEAQSLLDKLKQAFANMLETLEMSSNESASSEAGEERSGEASEEGTATGDPADADNPEGEAASESADASMEGGEPGEAAGETASAGSTGGEDSSGDRSGGENASAAGTSDGSKEFEQAQQLEVFGELEELYMQRAEEMAGEVTVEARRAEQSASVPYNQRSARPSDGQSAISRDEIPAAFRTYIQNYFEALREDPE